jgi:iron complex outermembrane receptor protein
MAKYFTILVGLFFSINALAQTGSLSGKVQSADQKPLPFVNVIIKGTQQGAVTDFTGYFNISGLKPGEYTVVASYIGYDKTETSITVEAGKENSVNMTLTETTGTLDEVVVTGYTNKQEAVRVLNRVQMSALENPQTINQIDNKLLKQQNNFTLSDALRNVAGVTNTGNSNNFTFQVRGFDPSTAINGILSPVANFDFSPNLFNIESIEVIKGPTGTIYGAGSPSGLINITTKKPKEVSELTVNATYGRFNELQTMVDATGALSKNKKLKYRLIGGFQQRAKLYEADNEGKNYFIAPQLQYDFSDKTTLAYEYNMSLQRDKTGRNGNGGGNFLPGVPLVPEDDMFNADGSFIPGSVDFLGLNFSDFNFSVPRGFVNTDDNLHQLRFRHKFSSNWELSVLSSYKSLSSKASSLLCGLVTLNDETLLPTKDNLLLNFERSFFTVKGRAFQVSPYLTGSINTGKLSHRIVLGTDYSFVNNSSFFSFPINDAFFATPLVNPQFPVIDYNDFTPDINVYSGDNNSKINSYAVYLQDVVRYKNFTLLAALRYDRFNEKVVNEIYDTGDFSELKDTTTVNGFAPRLGLTWQLTKSSSVYIGFNSGFRPNFDPGPGSGAPFDPERFNQIEVGARKEFYDGKLMTSIAFFRINRNNLLVADPTDIQQRRFIQVNEVYSQGVELTAVGKPMNGLNINVGYAYNPTFAPGELNNAGIDGRFPLAPLHNATIWANYELQQTKLKGLSFGLGGNYSSSAASFQPGLNRDAYTVFGSSIGYTRNKLSTTLNVENILNSNYMENIFGTSGGYRSLPRRYRISVSYTFGGNEKRKK